MQELGMPDTSCFRMQGFQVKDPYMMAQMLRNVEGYRRLISESQALTA
jgi:hypothetical protein